MKTVNLRFWIPLMVFMSTTLLIIGMFFYQTHLQLHNLKQQKIASVNYNMIRLQRFIEEALNHRNTSLIEQEISSFGIESEVMALALINSQEKIEYATYYAWKNEFVFDVIPFFNRAIFPLSIASKPQIEWEKNAPIITAYFPVRYPELQHQLRPYSYGVLYIRYDLTPLIAAIYYEVLTESSLLWIGCMLLMLLLAHILRYLVNKPIRHLVKVMENFSDDNQIKATLTGRGELAILGNTFNELTHKLSETQAHLLKQKNLYALLSETNQLLIHNQTAQQLFDEICLIAVKKPNLIFAWIGLNHSVTQQIILVAKASSTLNCLESLFNAEIAQGQDIVNQVIRENRCRITNQLVGNQHLSIQATAVFPICKFNQVLGAFSLYADEKDYFDEEVVCLLNEMTQDINFALEKIELNELRRQAEAKITQLAYYDALTALPNRQLLLERLTSEFIAAKQQGEFGALLFLDLDHFKYINDSLGHETGDELLIQVAQRLKSSLCEHDIVARLGGDEFVILLTHLSASLDNAMTLAIEMTEKILAVLREPYLLKEHRYHNNASLGVALFPLPKQNVAHILKQADTALYRAKDRGRNTFQFYRTEMQETADKRLELEKNLRDAIDLQQLQLYYQPQFNHINNVIGAEILLRWISPNLGFIPPDQFIPIAEETGLIVEMGYWIFQQSFRQIKYWVDSDILKENQHISINVSSKQFKETDFFPKVSQLIKETGANPAVIILELTESVFLDRIEETIEKMLQLRGLGFRFSIDDFGTGYSSLAYLKKLPLNELKIDKTFVDDIEHDNNDRVIVDTIIAMAKHLQFDVIAEGVETKQQLHFLKTHGCLNYQGYFFSKPLDKNTFEIFLSQHPFKK